jgi:hypothetical protein
MESRAWHSIGPGHRSSETRSCCSARPWTTLDKSCFVYQVYRCANCENCPLGTVCRSPKATRGRMIYRDPYEPLREELAARMKLAEGKATYARRMHGAETPFAYIKAVMGVRQFLLRGLENVRTEWRWVCTAFNLQKLLKAVAALRAPGAMDDGSGWLGNPGKVRDGILTVVASFQDGVAARSFFAGESSPSRQPSTENNQPKVGKASGISTFRNGINQRPASVGMAPRS